MPSSRCPARLAPTQGLMHRYTGNLHIKRLHILHAYPCRGVESGQGPSEHRSQIVPLPSHVALVEPLHQGPGAATLPLPATCRQTV